MPDLPTTTTTGPTFAPGRRTRGLSPDTVIVPPPHMSNFNGLFSDNNVLDHESLVSEITEQLAGGHEGEEDDDVVGGGCGSGESLNGTDLIHHTRLTQHSLKSGRIVPLQYSSNNCSPHSSNLICKKVDKVKVHTAQRREEGNRLLNVDDDQLQCLDSARNSFSLAVKECQERRFRSEAISKNSERRGPSSLDLTSNMSSSSVNTSPRLGGAMKKGGAVSSRKSGNFPSPGTLSYGHGSAGINKGWSSERVPLSTNGNRRQVGGAALLPFNSGRTLPSKWEDAERWIFSPVAGEGVVRPSYQQPQKRPKSKSGPLGPPGIASYSLYSPAAPMYYEGSYMSNFVVASPFSAGVIGADGLSIHANGDGGQFSNRGEPCIARSASVHGCSELVCQSSVATSQDEKVEDLKDNAANVSRAVSRRDMATQMSPARSSGSSPKRRSFLAPSTPSLLPSVKRQNNSSSKTDVRDVQVDERVTVTSWSKKHKSRSPSRASDDADDWKLKAVEDHSSSWEVPETAKNISKAKREEAKIIAWENLQKAKAEAAIRKLEMKLEKKRSSSMDKIMNKLRFAQKKAQEMRSAVLASQALEASKVSRRERQMGYLSGCFACDAC